jgi:hypothetical protein
MSETLTPTTTTAAERLSHRLKNTTVNDLQDKHAEAYTAGEKVAADELDIDELRSLDAYFVENIEDVPVSELDEDEVFTGIANVVGLDRTRDFLRERREPIEGTSAIAVFLLGIVETWREADV